MNEYNFYYDESEHSRKINHNTITADNYYDNFVAVIIGWPADNEDSLFKLYTAFEDKYDDRKSKGELKSTTIRQGQLKCGFASLNDENISFLDDFLSLFDKKIRFYFAVTSKIEYIIQQLFEGYRNSLFADMDAMKYSITKAIILYQPKEIIDGLYEGTSELVALLKVFFETQIKKNKANELLKQKENEQFAQILLLLDDVSEIKTIDWNYEISFMGFKNYLAEVAINNYSLFIDKEGDESNTAKAAEQVGIRSVAEVDSLEFFGVRMADMLAGIISKLLKALHNSLKYTSLEEQIHKKILDKSWFMINERQLTLYKKMYNVVVDLNKAWYKAFAGRYSDDLIVLVGILGFMNHFESVEEVKANIDMQGEYFNAYVCESMSDHYKRMRNKLPIDLVDKTSRECFINQRGAKVYFDINKQPMLEIKKGQLVCNVLSVGFSREMIPSITIMESNEAKCYRIPMELANWATTLVGFADMGENVFPCEVMFSKTKDRYYADLL